MLDRIHVQRLRTDPNKRGSVREKRVRNSEGKSVRVLSVDANSASFIDDLTLLFQKNVARIHRKYRNWPDSADGSRAKK
jgi:hypothetical protein